MSLLTIADLSKGDAAYWIGEAERLYGRYHEWLEEGEQGNPNDRAPGIHASEISMCERRVVYSIQGIEKKGKTSARMRKIFNIGHVVHDMLQKDFGKFANSTRGKITFKKEIPIDPFTNKVAELWQIYSACDGVFTFWEFNDRKMWVPVLRVGIEIKSINPDEFEKLNKPKPEHIEQGHIYQACLDLPLMWFVYYNKSNVNMTLSGGNFLTKFNPAIWKGLEERFEMFHNHVDQGTLPDREESMYCEGCAYEWTCQPEYTKKSFKKPELMQLRTSK
jgi:CRISPR/Cas system-associated exonuclease Cas4 (RecB family)